MKAPEARLDELDKLEWWDIARAVRPDITAAEFDAAWSKFVQLKAEHLRRATLH